MVEIDDLALNQTVKVTGFQSKKVRSTDQRVENTFSRGLGTGYGASHAAPVHFIIAI